MQLLHSPGELDDRGVGGAGRSPAAHHQGGLVEIAQKLFEAEALVGKDRESHQRDLFEAIEPRIYAAVHVELDLDAERRRGRGSVNCAGSNQTGLAWLELKRRDDPYGTVAKLAADPPRFFCP